MNQVMERVEGLGEFILNEYDFGPHDALLVVSATGTTVAAVDMALAYSRRYPHHPLIALCSLEQARKAPAKHSSGKNLYPSHLNLIIGSTNRHQWGAPRR